MSKVNPIDIDLINVDDDVHTDFSKYTMDQIVKSTKGSFLYAAYTLKKRFEPGEHAIARACLCEDGDPIQEFDIDYANQFLDLTDDGPDLATAYWGPLYLVRFGTSQEKRQATHRIVEEWKVKAQQLEDIRDFLQIKGMI